MSILRLLIGRPMIFAAVLVSTNFCQAKPRPPLPPAPEPGVLARWRFNDASDPQPLSAINAKKIESWSGSALQLSGASPALFALSGTAPNGKTNLNLSGPATLRFWFSPAWTSASAGGKGLGSAGTLVEAGAWSNTTSQSAWSLIISADGTEIYLVIQTTKGAVGLLEAPVDWSAGEWHQIALSWSTDGVSLFLDGMPAAHAPGAKLPTPSTGTGGLSLGGKMDGTALAQGSFEEFYSFGRVCSESEIAADYNYTAPLAALGPISLEEETQRRLAGAATRAAAAMEFSLSPQTSAERQSLLDAMGDCASELAISKSGTTVTLTIQNATPGKYYDIFRTMDFVGNSVENSTWRWVAKRMNGQSLTLQDPKCHAV